MFFLYRKQEILHDIISVDKKSTQYTERYRDAPTLRRYLDRETYWCYLFQQAQAIVKELLQDMQLLEAEMADFFFVCRDLHVDFAFSDLWPKLKPMLHGPLPHNCNF